MTRHVIIDTGPLLAFLCLSDAQHQWVNTQLDAVSPPLLTCEAVISETCFLLRRHHADASAVLALFQQQLLSVPFRIENESESILALMRKYADLPMSFADACLVRMSECYADSVILAFDRDFRTYRRFHRHSIPLLMP